MNMGNAVERDRVNDTTKRKMTAIIIVFLLVAISAVLARMASPLEAASKPSLNLEQCSNDAPTCDSMNAGEWVTGNLGNSNSEYREGDAVAYRSVLSNLVVGQTYGVSIEWDTTVSGKHAIDYLTSYNFSESTADPCAGIACAGGQSTLSISMDPSVSSEMVSQQGGQSFTVFGGTFPASGAVVNNTGGNLCASNSCTITSNPSSYSLSGSYASDSSTSVDIFFTATDQTAVLAWGGHTASRVDWGAGSSAAVINGSPYHMKVNGFTCTSDENCSSGEMDRSLSSAAVTLPGSITIVKQALTEGETEFGFTASPSPLENFTLVDDGTMANTKVFSGITTFGTYLVTENSANGWDFDRVECSIDQQSTGSTSVDGSEVTIILGEGENVLCSFYNERIPVPGLSLQKSANTTTFATAGETITYTYLLTNTGETILGPTQFTITDDKINSGVSFNCGDADTTLELTQTVTCTADYTAGEDDVTAGSVVNTASGSGGGVTSNTDTVTVAYVPVVTTTTTLAPTTTTTLAPTTTTLAPVTTTTVPTELQVLVPNIGTGTEDVFDVIFEDELPNAGWGIGLGSLIVGVLVLLSVGASSLALSRRNRQIQQEGGK